MNTFHIVVIVGVGILLLALLLGFIYHCFDNGGSRNQNNADRINQMELGPVNHTLLGGQKENVPVGADGNRRKLPSTSRVGVSVRALKPQNKNWQRPQSQSYDDNQTCLIIATDATPKHLGGYCVNPFTNTVEFYSIPSDRMPWALHDTSRLGDSGEFEMKNLLCALLLWEDLMLEHKRVKIYTDNWAVNESKWRNIGKYGRRVRNFIQHLKTCGGVKHLNPYGMHLNQNSNLKMFNEFIIPADHLSRKQNAEFRDCMNQGAWSDFELCDANVEKIAENARKWRRLHGVCGFQVGSTESLRGMYRY